MIDRGYASAAIAAAQADETRLLAFADIDWPNGRVRAHSGLGDRPFLGDIYKGVGEMGGIGRFTEKSDDSPISMTITLKVLDPAVVGLVLNDQPEGREILLHMAVLDENYVIEHELPYIFDGIITKFTCQRGDVNKGIPWILNLTCNDWMENWNKPADFVNTTNEAQHYLYPNDDIFNMTEVIAGAPLHSLPTKTISNRSYGAGGRAGILSNVLNKLR